MPATDEILLANQSRIDELHRCQSGQTALLVIDMQRGFLEPGAALEVPEGRQIIPNVRRLIEFAAGKACRSSSRSSSIRPACHASAAIRSESNICRLTRADRQGSVTLRETA